MSEQVTNTNQPIVLKVEASQPANEPSQLRDGREKRESELAEARTKGANDLLKAAGFKKSERARMIEEIRSGRVKLAVTKEEAAATQQLSTEAAQTAQTQIDVLKPYKDQVDQLTGALKEYADEAFNSLPEAFQKSIVDMKLDDPRARLDMIKVWKKNGVITPQAAAAAEAVKPVEQVKKPSTTMATPPSGTSTPASATMNHYEQWRSLVDSGQPFLAAQFLHAHQNKILEQRPKNR